jgi:hypothetical protein
MYLIQQVTSDPVQKQTLILPNGNTLTMQMYFVPMQYGWFISQMVYGTFTLNSLRITVSPNMLRQFKNQIPFGLACYANGVVREPSQQQDFSSNAFSLYILSAAEVIEYEELLAGNST